MAWRSNEVNTEPFNIIEAIIDGMHLQFAAVAGTGIYHSDCQAFAEDFGNLAVEFRYVWEGGRIAVGEGFGLAAGF